MAIRSEGETDFRLETPPPRKKGSVEGARRGGMIAGAIAKAHKSGICDPAVQSAAGKLGGKITGRANAELKRGCCAPGVASRAGKAAAVIGQQRRTGLYSAEIRARGLHTRWHVRRGILKLGCAFCECFVLRSA